MGTSFFDSSPAAQLVITRVAVASVGLESSMS
jgi:hypothetical protein